MKSIGQIREEIKRIEDEIIDKIREGYTHIKYAQSSRLTTLRWVLEDNLI